MSFGAMAGWQAWGLLALTAGVLSWLFFMKIRAPRVHVPSLMLWTKVLDATREMTLWERIRKAVSWLVIVATGLMLMLALTRPAPGVAATSGGRRLIVIDSSWSMGTETSSGGTRWDRALTQARTLIAASAGDEVALATTADGLIEGPTTDSVLLEAALDRTAPAGGESGDWPQLAGVAVVHFITDGTLPRATADLEASGARVTIQSVFEAASNVAITAFEVHAGNDPDNKDAQDEAYLELANYSATPQKVRLVVTRGTAEMADASIDLAAGEAVRQIVPLGRQGDARVRARVSGPDNALEIDDEAVAWISGAEQLAVTVVSEAPGFLQILFDRLPGVKAAFIAPAAYAKPRTGAEHVVVFDHWAPPEAPVKPALFISPPDPKAGAAWMGTARDERTPQWNTSLNHPVLNGVDPTTVTLERARTVVSDLWTPIATSVTGTPLVSVAETADHRRVLLGFGLMEAESNVALQPAFPVLIVNALEWLGRPALGAQVRPGVVPLNAAVSHLTSPDGKRIEVTAFGDTRLARITAPGLYLAEGGGMRSALAVNVGDPQVSNVARTSLTEATMAATAAEEANDPWWPTLIAIAFVLGLVEWWTWQRRITV